MDTATLAAFGSGAVGVLGTLFSALLTQRASDRTKRRELEHADQQRREESREQHRQAGWEIRRASYIAFNTAARQYLIAVNDHRHVLLRGEPVQASRDRLDEARATHQDCYAEAQLSVPDELLGDITTVNKVVNQLYGSIRAVDDGTPLTGDSLDRVQDRIDAAWPRLRLMRHRMRVDLGVAADD